MSSEIIIYQNISGDIKIDVRLEEETVWLTQDQMATLLVKPNPLSTSILRTFMRKKSWKKQSQ